MLCFTPSFCRSEAAALLDRQCTAREAALALGPHADMVVVTDGADGSCISALGSLQVSDLPVVITCVSQAFPRELLAPVAKLITSDTANGSCISALGSLQVRDHLCPGLQARVVVA